MELVGLVSCEGEGVVEVFCGFFNDEELSDDFVDCGGIRFFIDFSSVTF